MVNDLTTFAADIHWLRDGGDTGYHHARSNIAEVLGAMQFLPGWTCQRWNNRIHENDPANDELTRFYCRSAMPGIWGISEDLSKVDPRQLAVVRQEVEHYRRLNQLKLSGVWDIHYPDADSDIAAITFYDESGSKAALLVYRWDAAGVIEKTMIFSGLKNNRVYKVQNADSAEFLEKSYRELVETGLDIQLTENQLSVLYFIE